VRKYKVKFTEDAKQDLKSISTYIKNILKEPYIAKRLIKKDRRKDI
jgi:plasmid stabilization system protein ParE